MHTLQPSSASETLRPFFVLDTAQSARRSSGQHFIHHLHQVVQLEDPISLFR